MLWTLASLTATGPHLLTTCAGEGRPWWVSAWRRETGIQKRGKQRWGPGPGCSRGQSQIEGQRTGQICKLRGVLFSTHPIVYLVFLWMFQVAYQTCDIFSIPQRSADPMFPSPTPPSALKGVGRSHHRSDRTILLCSMLNNFPCAVRILGETWQRRQCSAHAAPCPHMWQMWRARLESKSELNFRLLK